MDGFSLFAKGSVTKKAKKTVEKKKVCGTALQRLLPKRRQMPNFEEKVLCGGLLVDDREIGEKLRGVCFAGERNAFRGRGVESLVEGQSCETEKLSAEERKKLKAREKNQRRRHAKQAAKKAAQSAAEEQPNPDN